MVPTPKQFFYQVRGTTIGPVTGIDLREAALAGNVVPSTLVSSSPDGSWVPAVRVRGLFDDNGKPLPHPGTGHFVQRTSLTPSAKQPCDAVAISGGTDQPQQFYFIHAGNVIGPMTEFDLRECAYLGNVVPTTLVANDPNGDWLPASRIRNLFDKNGKPFPHPRQTAKLLTDASDSLLGPLSARAIPSIDELLDRWEEAREEGKSIPVEELCRDCPELQDELRRQIRELEWVDDVMITQTSAELHEGEAIEISKSLGRYRLNKMIGQGGFGQVWEAYDPDLERVVAIKILRPERQGSVIQTERFLAEAKKVAKLSHKNIVAIHDIGRDGELSYMVTDLIDGSDLAQVLKDGGVSTTEAVRIVTKIADALQHAHENGVVHRDVKPHNILLDRKREPYITDFGIAVTDVELVDGGSDSAGTPAYMAPEQANLEGPVVDRRCDIYSLGVVFYELLTGESPYDVHTLSDLRASIRTKQPRPLRSLVPTVPENLESVCMKALAKLPSDRYFTAKELADALRATGGTSKEAVLWTTVLVAILLLAAGATLGVVSYSMGGRTPGEQHVGTGVNAERFTAANEVAENTAERFAAASKVAEGIEREHRDVVSASDRGARESEIRAGVQQALDQHRQQLEKVRARLQFDSEYFASLILLSAHEGLLGNSTEEWKLLIQYWQEFSKHVEEEQANLVFQEADALVFEAGLFFQQLVDDGEYDAAAYFDYSHDEDAEDAYLKPTLIGHYHWPKFAAFWPFDREQRDAFAFAFGITSDGSKDPKRFEQRQPRHPHDYLEIAALRKDYDYLQPNGNNPENPDFVDIARIRGSILQYYAKTALTDDVGARYLEDYPWSFLHSLETCDPDEWPEASLKDLILGLQFLSKSPAHHKYAGKAAKLLEGYEARWAMLNVHELPHNQVAP